MHKYLWRIVGSNDKKEYHEKKHVWLSDPRLIKQYRPQPVLKSAKSKPTSRYEIIQVAT